MTRRIGGEHDRPCPEANGFDPHPLVLAVGAKRNDAYALAGGWIAWSKAVLGDAGTLQRQFFRRDPAGVVTPITARQDPSERRSLRAGGKAIWRLDRWIAVENANAVGILHRSATHQRNPVGGPLRSTALRHLRSRTAGSTTGGGKTARPALRRRLRDDTTQTTRGKRQEDAALTARAVPALESVRRAGRTLVRSDILRGSGENRFASTPRPRGHRSRRCLRRLLCVRAVRACGRR